MTAIAGVSWKHRCRKDITIAERPSASLDALPTPAFDLVDFDAYERAVR